eukprot:TRINITY_DN89_c6_g1_i1.p1 TRINITY_DN89_c6_g1~~TRINITY_DN89_c6_g1_i1.p1  ORF type:complete len:181 (+),score=87.51 TRINITY_DN89_c6_g1_i1:116-658(+)
MSDEDDFMSGFGQVEDSSEEKPKKEKEQPKPTATTTAPTTTAPVKPSGGGQVSAGLDDFRPIIVKQQKDQMGCIFAALLLHGDGDNKVEITSDKLLNILRASRIDPNPFFTNLYAGVLATTDIKEIVLSGLGGGSSSAPVSSGPVTSAPVETKAEVKEAPKKEEKEEESASIGGLFGDDD